jgi:hypothetical protein
MKHISSRSTSAKRRWSTVVIGTMLILGLLGSPAFTTRRAPSVPNRPTGLASQEISPAALTPNTPSKEYIRLGGKLVAVEEPAP